MSAAKSLRALGAHAHSYRARHNRVGGNLPYSVKRDAVELLGKYSLEQVARAVGVPPRMVLSWSKKFAPKDSTQTDRDFIEVEPISVPQNRPDDIREGVEVELSYRGFSLRVRGPVEPATIDSLARLVAEHRSST